MNITTKTTVKLNSHISINQCEKMIIQSTKLHFLIYIQGRIDPQILSIVDIKCHCDQFSYSHWQIKVNNNRKAIKK